MMPPKQTTLLDFQSRCDRGEKLAVVTAYDYSMALAVDAAGVDAILVGDSLSMTMLGRPNTLSATMDEMIHHTKAVVKGVQKALVIGDLPFFFPTNWAWRKLWIMRAPFLPKPGAQAVKLEWCPQAPERRHLLRGLKTGISRHVGPRGFYPPACQPIGGVSPPRQRQNNRVHVASTSKGIRKSGGSFAVSFGVGCPERCGRKNHDRLRLKSDHWCTYRRRAPLRRPKSKFFHDLLGPASGFPSQARQGLLETP